MVPDGWEIKRLGELGRSMSGLTYSPADVVAEGGILVLRSSNILNGEVVYGDKVYVTGDVPDSVRTKSGDILICARNGSRSLIGKSALIDKDSAGHAFGAFMAVFRAPDSKYIFQLFQSPMFKKQVDRHLGATINQVTAKSLNSFKFLIPPKAERERIVSILSTWDQTVSKTLQLLKLKRRLKRGMMQQLLNGRRRFPGFASQSWRKCRLRDVAEECCIRNRGSLGVDSVMAVKKIAGMVPMKPETIASSIERYQIVKRDWFAYNPMRLNIGSIARWSENRNVLVSPDYVVFRCKDDEIDPDYLHHFRRSHIWTTFMNACGNGSVRVRIWFADLGALKIHLPPIDEQRKIASFLNIADREIDLLEQQLTALRKQKKGLMQKLLTGNVRLKVKTKGSSQ